MHHHMRVDPAKLSAPERALWRAFPRGEPIDLTGPVSLRNCEFEVAIDLSGANTRGIALEGSQLTGLLAPLAAIDWSAPATWPSWVIGLSSTMTCSPRKP